MPAVQIACSTFINNVSSEFSNGSYESATTTNSTVIGEDSVGAMKFTIAVVLVYGIGVIGILGISARRSRRRQIMDKEVHKYIKSKFSFHKGRRRKRKKRTILKLITSLHNVNRNDNAYQPNWLKLWAAPTAPRSTQSVPGWGKKIRPHILCRASTWAGELGKTLDTFIEVSGDESYSTLPADTSTQASQVSETQRFGVDISLDVFTETADKQGGKSKEKCHSDQKNTGDEHHYNPTIEPVNLENDLGGKLQETPKNTACEAECSGASASTSVVLVEKRNVAAL